MYKPLRERIEGLIAISDTGCWVWQGRVTAAGYGQMTIRNGTLPFKTALAHRIAYQQWRGPVPEGLELDHLCRVRHCVNPDHLEAVTHSENIRRGAHTPRPKRKKPGERAKVTSTHCAHGHLYDDTNTYWSPAGNRYCRKCGSAASARYMARRKAAALTDSAIAQGGRDGTKEQHVTDETVPLYDATVAAQEAEQAAPEEAQPPAEDEPTFADVADDDGE